MRGKQSSEQVCSASPSSPPWHPHQRLLLAQGVLPRCILVGYVALGTTPCCYPFLVHLSESENQNKFLSLAFLQPCSVCSSSDQPALGLWLKQRQARAAPSCTSGPAPPGLGTSGSSRARLLGGWEEECGMGRGREIMSGYCFCYTGL